MQIRRDAMCAGAHAEDIARTATNTMQAAKQCASTPEGVPTSNGYAIIQEVGCTLILLRDRRIKFASYAPSWVTTRVNVNGRTK